MKLMPVIVLTAALSASQTLASAQQMPMSLDAMMMMPSKMVTATITAVRYVSCSSGSQGCQGIFVVTPSPHEEMPSGMMPMPMMSQVERVTGNQPLTVIFIPNTHFMWQGSSFPLTRLKVDDRVMLGYRTLDGMNVVVGGMMVGMRKEAR
jgi:hypothetical protein